MSEIGEIFKELKEIKRKKKLSNIDHSTYLLIEKGFDVDIRNNGVHLIIKYGGFTVDFWPSTGRYIFRSGKSGRGVKRLIKELENKS